jgi:uncharacterized RDD family membrane protein YckC
MTDLEQLWRAKSDEEVMEAGARLAEYTLDGREVIRAELMRRRLHAPPQWECSKCHERIDDAFDSCWKCGASREGDEPGLDVPQPTSNPVPDHAVEGAMSRYRTFWPRFWAGILDGFILMPVALVMSWLAMYSSVSALTFLFVASEALGVTYSILLHGRYGQTLGKKWLGVKVLHVNESRLTMRQAIVRDSPLILMSAVSATIGIRYIANGGNPLAFERMPMPDFLVYAGGLWFLAEVATMLTNEKRRALHDWIAGSVVVRVSK